MISVVARGNEIAPLSIDLKEYLKFEKNSKINYVKSNFQIDDNIPVLDGASAAVSSLFCDCICNTVQTQFLSTVKISLKKAKFKCETQEGLTKLLLMVMQISFFVLHASKGQLVYAKQNNIELEFVPIGLEAFVFIENMNPVDDLSIEQIKGIYSGKIKNWKEVGGTNTLIAAWQRKKEISSQTTFLKFMNGGKDKIKSVGYFL